jgi:hypothetical protein
LVVGAAVVGDDVGVTVVGDTVGCLVGFDVGFIVGLVVDGDTLGSLVGFIVVGTSVGASEGYELGVSEVEGVSVVGATVVGA